LPEVEKLAGRRILCVYGDEEAQSLCPRVSGGRTRVLALKGGHHFGGSYEAIAEAILKQIGR
jgi:type IV secretory pathway VirJ component